MIADFDNSVVVTPTLLEERRNRILQLEQAMAQIPESFGMHEFNEGRIQHHFGTGVYGRELFIPAGTTLMSKIHKGKTLNVIALGKITVVCPHRGSNTYTAPFTFVSEPLTKRVVHALEDTLWITAHINENNSEDLEEIEQKTIALNFDDKLLTKGE